MRGVCKELAPRLFAVFNRGYVAQNYYRVTVIEPVYAYDKGFAAVGILESLIRAEG